MGAPIRASASSGIQRSALQLLEASERTHSAEQARGSLLPCAFRPPRVQGRLFVQARWMLRMRGRGAGAAAPCTREHACLGSGNAAPQHQIWMRRRQEAFAGLARLAPCAGGAALFDGARSEAGLAGARRSAPRRVSGIRCDACKLLEASDCFRAAEWALRSLLAASPEFHRTPAAGLGKRAESFVAERKAAAKFGALRPKLSM